MFEIIVVNNYSPHFMRAKIVTAIMRNLIAIKMFNW